MGGIGHSSRRRPIVPHVLSAPTPPKGGVLHSAALRSGRDSQGQTAADAPSPIGARDRGSVASLPCARTTRAHRWAMPCGPGGSPARA